MRKIPGLGMQEKVRGEVQEFMHKRFDRDEKTLAEQMDGLGFSSPDDRFHYAFCVYSNNFWAHVVDSKPTVVEAAYGRRLERLDEPLGPGIRQTRKLAKSDPKHYHVRPRSVMERRTSRQFFDDIQRAAKEAGIMAELDRTVEAGINTQTAITIGRLLLPVYVKLREMGYSHDDLD
jgi:hypothetical protein